MLLELSQNLRGEIEKIAQFLGKNLTDEQLTKLTAHLRFDSFAKNETVNLEIGKEIGVMNNSGHFMRKGNTRNLSVHKYNTHMTRVSLRQEKPGTGKIISLPN